MRHLSMLAFLALATCGPGAIVSVTICNDSPEAQLFNAGWAMGTVTGTLLDDAALTPLECRAFPHALRGSPGDEVQLGATVARSDDYAHHTLSLNTVTLREELLSCSFHYTLNGTPSLTFSCEP